MVGTEYFNETAQPRDQIPHTHFGGTDKTIHNRA